MKFKLLTFSICMTMYSGAWSAPYSADDNAKRSDYFGFSTGYQPTQDYFSPNVIYGLDIGPSLVIESQLGYNSNTKLDNKNFLTRLTLYGRSSFSSNTSLLHGPFVQYEDDINPFRAGFSSVVQHRLGSDVKLFGGLSAVVKKEFSVRVVPEFNLGMTWALPSSKTTRTIASEPMSSTSQKVTEEVAQQPTLPPKGPIVEAAQLFNVNSSYISSTQVLKESIQYLNQHPDVHVRIINKHSKGGSVDYNRWLGQRRVERLHAFYSGNGINAERLEINSSFDERENLEQPLVQFLYYTK
ncbi:hypothetical protein [Vibrio sp. Hep-1b-8]|uniref:OmpA family protein n=1 Tax=Vibrio sp. Hep-1b-8 TaxID=2144187 RepID=UPI001F0EB00D|nr:hypothetical protein [Vibrio sp. Hep-1b-8]